MNDESFGLIELSEVGLPWLDFNSDLNRNYQMADEARGVCRGQVGYSNPPLIIHNRQTTHTERTQNPPTHT